jgi:hypothetical protein
MLATTKEVRVAGKCAAGFSAHYTEKTSKHNPQRRCVVWQCWGDVKAPEVAKLMSEKFAELGYTNKVTVTSGYYVRVIADIA